MSLKYSVMEIHEQERHWEQKAMTLYMLALKLANSTPDFYKVKNAGLGDHASNQFMKNLRQLASSTFGSDFSEKRVCKGTKHAFDFYIPDEGGAIEIALSLHNPLSGHLKTGHTGSPENRPTELAQDSVVLLHRMM